MTERELPASLKITTSIARAIEIHPMTHWKSFGDKCENEFLGRFDLEFKVPNPGNATLTNTGMIPDPNWFLLFEEAEKEIMEDEYAFYGIQYSTTVKAAIKRLEKHLEDFQKEFSSDLSGSKEKRDWKTRKRLYERDKVKDMLEALKSFGKDDELELNFVFTQWPDIEIARKTDYIKEFESKVKAFEERSEPEFDFPY